MMPRRKYSAREDEEILKGEQTLLLLAQRFGRSEGALAARRKYLKKKAIEPQMEVKINHFDFKGVFARPDFFTHENLEHLAVAKH